jgi:hypothetical protein
MEIRRWTESQPLIEHASIDRDDPRQEILMSTVSENGVPANAGPYVDDYALARPKEAKEIWNNSSRQTRDSMNGFFGSDFKRTIDPIWTGQIHGASHRIYDDGRFDIRIVGGRLARVSDVIINGDDPIIGNRYGGRRGQGQRDIGTDLGARRLIGFNTRLSTEPGRLGADARRSVSAQQEIPWIPATPTKPAVRIASQRVYRAILSFASSD